MVSKSVKTATNFVTKGANFVTKSGKNEISFDQVILRWSPRQGLFR